MPQFFQWFITQRHSQFNDSRFSSSVQSIFKIQFLQSFNGLYSPKTEHNFPQKGLNSSQMGLNSPHITHKTSSNFVQVFSLQSM